MMEDFEMTKTLRKSLLPLMVTLIFTFAMSGVAIAQTNLDAGAYMIGFYLGANAGLPDAQMHVVNPGSTGGYGAADESPAAAPQGGDLCANIYVFTSDEQMIDCCSCKISPNGMQGFSLALDLVGNPLTGLVPKAGAIKVIASQGPGSPGSLNPPPIGPTDLVAGPCDAGTTYTPAGQLQSWVTHVRSLPTGAGASHAVTEIPFSAAALSASELTKVQSQCFAIEAFAGRGGVGSGAGLCKCNPAQAF